MLKFTEKEQEQIKKYIIDKICELHKARAKATNNEKKQKKLDTELATIYNIKRMLKF